MKQSLVENFHYNPPSWKHRDLGDHEDLHVVKETTLAEEGIQLSLNSLVKGIALDFIILAMLESVQSQLILLYLDNDSWHVEESKQKLKKKTMWCSKIHPVGLQHLLT